MKATQPKVTQPQANPPNLVFIFPDQHRIQALGHWSQAGFANALRGTSDPVHTPHLDAFAKQSLVLTRSTSTAPVCSPFRGMLFTGCFPERSGVPINCGHDRPECELDITRATFAKVLAQANYDCGYIGKYHLDFAHQFDPSRPDWYPGGWDVYTPPERRPGFHFWHAYGTFDVHKNPHYWNAQGERTDPKRWSALYEADIACDFIHNNQGQRNTDKPFALFVAMNPPHTPNVSLDDCEEEDFLHYVDMAADELLTRPNVVNKQAVADRARYYYAQVTGVDRAFGRIMTALHKAGLGDDTIVVFTSDHGELLGSHGRGGKNRIWSECFDIPFMLRYPSTITHRLDDLLFTPVDMMPSLLGLMGIQPPADMDGIDYASLWRGAATAKRPESVMFMRNQPGPTQKDNMHLGYVPAARGIKTHTHTLVYENLAESCAPVLYHDDADPYQMHPLPLAENEALVRDLKHKLRTHCIAANDPWSIN